MGMPVNSWDDDTKLQTLLNDSNNILSSHSVRATVYTPFAVLLSHLPDIIKKIIFVVWFNLCVTVTFVILYICCACVHLLRTTDEQSKKWCSILCHYFFRYGLLLPCPWITVDHDVINWDTFARQEKVCFILNHTSFLDSVIYVATTPPHIIYRNKTLMMASLFRVPILGRISSWVGHFPVHFKAGDSDVVDRGLQGVVMEQVHEYVESGGGLCFYPEGGINKSPYTMRNWRRGALRVAERHDMKYAFWAHVGCPQAWPRGIPLGGYPASIRLSVRPFTRPSDTETINPDRSSTQTSGSNSPVQTNTVGHTGVDAEADTERFDRLCALLQEELQHDIDRLVHRPVADS